MAPTLYEYDSFGNITRQSLALEEEPDSANSPVTELAYALEWMEEGIFSCTTQTRYNATGGALTGTRKQLISQLSATLAEKVVSTNERGLTSADWTVYNNGTKRLHYSTVPTSDITAETVAVDGFTLSQKDTAGMTMTASRSYTAAGMALVEVDGRGNTTTTVMDKAGRTLTVTDAAGNTTSTAYDTNHDQPSVITDAQGNTACYRYDIRGRKAAEWGTGTQPALFAYDDADRLTALTTFRADSGDISADPGDRTDGDTTTWAYDPATGLELRKTYTDNSSVAKTYDAFNRLSTETNARGIVKTHSYERSRGLHIGTTYSDNTAGRSYAYNHLGQLIQETDEAGSRTFSYNSYGEQETDSLTANGVTHLITETRDSFGRSTGYTYARNGELQHTVTTGYGTDGRIATAGFMHGGAEKRFSYSYLSGSDLLQSLAMPNNMTLTQSYEANRDLLTGMYYKRSTTGVVEREYSYDALGRPATRRTARQGTTKSDTFAYNNRSESPRRLVGGLDKPRSGFAPKGRADNGVPASQLTAATVSGESYSYAYDNIGNRKSAQEAAEEVTHYTANALNQYTAIDDFVPTYDADGNQTLVQTATGIWSVQYNAENRPVLFTRTEADGTETQIACTYDTMGRRATKQVTENGRETLNQRYIYRGYLQVAACDQTRSGHPCLWLMLWDPTEPIATRPLAIRKDGTWYCYGWDLTKNVCEVFGQHGYIRTAYTYTPYGTATADGDVTQPLQWSSEYADEELGLTYYNYRHYNPTVGRWLGRDPIGEESGKNLINFCKNSPIKAMDVLGKIAPGYDGAQVMSSINRIQEEHRVDNGIAHGYCNNYSQYNGSQCCQDKVFVTDSYIGKAMDMCHKFVDKYSVNSKVIKPVECVAKCLSEAEGEHISILNCADRNAARLLKHISCYASCGFFLFDSNTMGTPEGGWDMGFNEMLPALGESLLNKVSNSMESARDSIYDFMNSIF